MEEITVVIPFRNREVKRVINAWNSVIKNNRNVKNCIVSDYGSDENIIKELEIASTINNFKLIKSFGQGLPFNKARAVNIGVRFVETKYVCVLDADMIIHDNILDYISNEINENDVYFVESHWPQSKKSNPKRARIHLSYGVFQVQNKKWFELLNGYNEDFEFWGGEDSDWARRLLINGANYKVLRAQQFLVTHTWHPRENSNIRRPKNLIWKTIELEMSSMLSGVSNVNWGKLLELKDRKILTNNIKIDHKIDLTKKSIVEDFKEIADILNSGGHIQFILGNRIENRKLSFLSFVFKPFIRFFELFGYELSQLTSTNLEYLLIALNLWKDNIEDKILADDYSKFDILLKPKD